MLQNLKITHKIILAIASAVFISTLVNGVIVFVKERSIILEEERASLTYQARVLGREYRDYLYTIVRDMDTLAALPSTIATFHAFNDAFAQLGANATAELQELYITKNPNPTGEKEKLDAAADGSAYSRVHAQQHPSLRVRLQKQGY